MSGPNVVNITETPIDKLLPNLNSELIIELPPVTVPIIKTPLVTFKKIASCAGSKEKKKKQYQLGKFYFFHITFLES